MTRCARCCTKDITVSETDIHHDDGTVTRSAPLCSSCATQDRRRGIVTPRRGRMAGAHR